MKNQADSNIYEFAAASTAALYADFVDGCPDDIVVVLAERSLGETARAALASSAERLGYGARACAWVTLEARGDAGTRLGAADVLSIIESLDPAAIVAADSRASAALGAAYDHPLSPDAHARIRGREVIAFSNFEDALGDADAKQRAWALLKKANRLRG